MIPIFTKHYTLGLIVGTGFGLFLAYLLADSGIVVDAGSRRFLGAGVGLTAMIIGGFLYGMDLRKPAAKSQDG